MLLAESSWVSSRPTSGWCGRGPGFGFAPVGSVSSHPAPLPKIQRSVRTLMNMWQFVSPVFVFTPRFPCICSFPWLSSSLPETMGFSSNCFIQLWICSTGPAPEPMLVGFPNHRIRCEEMCHRQRRFFPPCAQPPPKKKTDRSSDWRKGDRSLAISRRV